MNSRSFLLSALISGSVIAILNFLPFLVPIQNSLCLIYPTAGAILSVYLYRRFNNIKPYISVFQGAMLGAVSAFIGFCILYVVSPFAFPQSEVDEIANNLDNSLRQLDISPIEFLLFLSIDFSILGAIGGLIATGLIWKKPQEVSG